MAEQCEGQLNLVCDSCEGQRIIRSDDTPPEVCSDCDGTGIDPAAAWDALVVRAYHSGRVHHLCWPDGCTNLSAAVSPSRPSGRDGG